MQGAKFRRYELGPHHVHKSKLSITYVACTSSWAVQYQHQRQAGEFRSGLKWSQASCGAVHMIDSYIQRIGIAYWTQHAATQQWHEAYTALHPLHISHLYGVLSRLSVPSRYLHCSMCFELRHVQPYISMPTATTQSHSSLTLYHSSLHSSYPRCCIPLPPPEVLWGERG